MSHCPIDLEGQSPSRTLSQASTIATEDNTALQSPRPSNWAVVIQSLDDNCILHDVAVNPAETGERIWSHVREQVITLSILACIWNWLLACFTRTIVGTATMTQMMHFGHETKLPEFHRQVSIQDFKQDWLLTRAFQHPPLLSQCIDYPTRNHRFTTNPKVTESKLNQQDVLVIRRIIDKTKVAWLLIILLILSPGLGLIIGLCTHKAEVGIAVSAGVFALAAFLQGLAAWFHI